MSLFNQDPAEDFLLKSTQVLCSPPRTSWPPPRPLAHPAPQRPFPSSSFLPSASSSATTLIPASLLSKDRKTTKFHEPSVPGEAFDVLRRIPSPEESDEWRKRRMEAAKEKRKMEFERAKAVGEVYDLDGDAAIAGGAKGKGKGKAVEKQPVIDLSMEGEESDEESDTDKELCVICLQGLRDRTVIGECGHQGFCFECINVWANQSRRCPLCSAPMSQFLLHDLDSPVGPSKFYLPPLPTIRPPPTSTFSSSLTSRPHVPPFRQRGPEVLFSDRTGTGKSRDIWAESRREDGGEEDELERGVERRRGVYRAGLFAKHIASNIHTRYKPTPTPRQFAENPEMVARATAFLRRELRVWRSVDVEFLTTYIISLMRSIDIRSEPAVRLLADFLDAPGLVGRERKGAEHFAHEVYSFLRSPYRDLAVYDAVVQYDPIPIEPEPSSSTLPKAPGSILVSGRSEIALDDMEVDNGPPAQDRGRSRSGSISRSDSLSRSRSRSRSPRRRARYRSRSFSPPPRSNLSPKRWDRRDTYIPPPSPPSRDRPRSRSPRRRDWRRKDSWIDPEVVEERRKHQERLLAEREETMRREILPSVEGEDATVEGAGMRGWGEAAMEEEVVVEREDVQEQQPAPEPPRLSLALRIFGASRIFGNGSPQVQAEEIESRSRAVTPDRAPSIAGSSELDEDQLDDLIWGGVDSREEAEEAERAREERAEEVRRMARKERLLGKLIREKRMSARREREAEVLRVAEEKRVAEEEGEKAEAKARAKLRLKMKLKKEKKAVMVVATEEEEEEMLAAMFEEREDRAEVLKKRLMEKRKAKEAEMEVV